MAIEQDPALAAIRGTAEFQELIRDMAGAWLERARQRGRGMPADLLVMAQAHVVRGEYAPAAALLEQALAAGGPFEPVLRAELAAVRIRESGETGSASPLPEETPDGPPGT
jgi:Tfp pilus assembly protein PilF